MSTLRLSLFGPLDIAMSMSQRFAVNLQLECWFKLIHELN